MGAPGSNPVQVCNFTFFSFHLLTQSPGTESSKLTITVNPEKIRNCPIIVIAEVEDMLPYHVGFPYLQDRETLPPRGILSRITKSIIQKRRETLPPRVTLLPGGTLPHVNGPLFRFIYSPASKTTFRKDLPKDRSHSHRFDFGSYFRHHANVLFKAKLRWTL